MKYFKIEEFNCDGVICYDKMDIDLLRMLDKAREYANTPFKLTSTWRSVEKNNSLKNSSKNSSHIKGKAVDIACADSVTRQKIVTGLIKAGFTRIGISKKGNFIHADNDDKTDAIWLY
tara:strand:- start:104 stop:457 length:354 start_codon:yes stop_codon:yes gene_type:complete